MAEVGVFHKTKYECGNSQDVTWALRAPVEGMPTTSSCTDLRAGFEGEPSHTCQTIFTTCFTKTFVIKHLRGETKVTAKYMKAAACTPSAPSTARSAAAGEKSSLCTVKKIVYDCQQCETQRRTTANPGVENLQRMLSIYDSFKATPPEASTLANANCIADAQLPADLKAGTCSGSNLVTAVMKG